MIRNKVITTIESFGDANYSRHQEAVDAYFKECEEDKEFIHQYISSSTSITAVGSYMAYVTHFIVGKDPSQLNLPMNLPKDEV